MRKIIFALLFPLSALAALPSVAQAATVAEPKVVPQLAAALKANAPERHVVVPGDTLWGIASKFLKDPYRWGELFKLNTPGVRNPNLIYPGQVLVLDRSSGVPQLMVKDEKLSPREYVEPLAKAIWTVSPEAIEPFLTKPLVVDKGGLDDAARVVGLEDNRVIAGAGDKLYVVNVDKPTRDWQMFRPGEALKEPVTGEVLGHEALFLGTARQLNEAQPTTFLIATAKQELVVGDRLLPSPPADIVTYQPRAPSAALRGHVLGLAGGVAFAGRNNVVSIGLGKTDGLELGHVLALDRTGDRIEDRVEGGFRGGKTTIQLPDQRNGLVFVFRVFDRVSYGLIMEAARPVQRGDAVRTP
jgi:LysM repeat protein